MSNLQSELEPEVKYFPSEPDTSEFYPEIPNFSLYAVPTSDALKLDIILPPSYPEVNIQEFVLATGLTGITLKAFSSENAMRLYKTYTKLSKKHQDFARAKINQNRSIGMPLLVSKRSSRLSLGVGDTCYLRFFECMSSPEATDRLYDRVDNRPIGEALRRKFAGYFRYRLQIRGVEIVIISHMWLSIWDWRLQGERFRLVKAANPSSNPSHFLYDLYLLAQNQPSLVDDMDSSLRVSKLNPLRGNSLQNFFGYQLSVSDREKYTSPHKLGSFEYHQAWGLFSKMQKCSIFSMFGVVNGEPDSNNTVDFRSLVLVAIMLIVQSYEIDQQVGRAI